MFGLNVARGIWGEDIKLQSNLGVGRPVANSLLLLLLLLASCFTYIGLSIWMVIVLFPVVII
jgi:predicted small secreted protein